MLGVLRSDDLQTLALFEHLGVGPVAVRRAVVADLRKAA